MCIFIYTGLFIQTHIHTFTRLKVRISTCRHDYISQLQITIFINITESCLCF